MWQKSIDLLEKFSFNEEGNLLDPARKYFLIFDIDGTLRPDQVEALDHRYPKIPAETAKQLSELNKVDNFDVNILTARSYLDLFRSNFPRSIKKYCGCGRQIIENDVLKYAREEFARSYDETVIFIELLEDIIGKELVSCVDFLVTPGDFAMYFDLEDYQEAKIKIMEKVNFLLEKSSRWQVIDFGKEIICIDTKYKYDKGDAVWDILDERELSDLPNHVFMFGDSVADHKAMIGLRNYQKQYPQKKLKVNNVSVGSKLQGYEGVDFAFETYEETIKFIDDLYKRLAL